MNQPQTTNTGNARHSCVAYILGEDDTTARAFAGERGLRLEFTSCNLHDRKWSNLQSLIREANAEGWTLIVNAGLPFDDRLLCLTLLTAANLEIVGSTQLDDVRTRDDLKRQFAELDRECSPPRSEASKAGLGKAKAGGKQLGSARPGHWADRQAARREGLAKAVQAAAAANRTKAWDRCVPLIPIFQRMKDETLQALANELNRLGFKPPRGDLWTPKQVSRVRNRIRENYRPWKRRGFA